MPSAEGRPAIDVSARERPQPGAQGFRWPRALAGTRAITAAVWLFGYPLSANPPSDHAVRIHGQRYAMGTMVEVLVYHEAAGPARHAVDAALDEVVRLDRVMSSFDASSELSMLNSRGRHGFVRITPDLYDVIEQSLAISRRSGGRFDVTVGPLVRLWRTADDEGRRPSQDEIGAVGQCVGYDRMIELRAPDRVRLRSPCASIDLGGIGKGYAVDRALAVLAAAGIRHGFVNAGQSSIGAMGHPPDGSGWPVILREGEGELMLRLRDASLSTSQAPAGSGPSLDGSGILDPRTGAPIARSGSVTVTARRAATADALSTALVMMTREEAAGMVAGFGEVSALWMAPDGTVSGRAGSAQRPLTAAR